MITISKINETLFGKELKIINIGLESFAEDLKKQRVKVIEVNWKPPAKGKKELLDLLEKLDALK